MERSLDIISSSSCPRAETNASESYPISLLLARVRIGEEVHLKRFRMGGEYYTNLFVFISIVTIPCIFSNLLTGVLAGLSSGIGTVELINMMFK